jgi:biopolymer transport protein ExbD
MSILTKIKKARIKKKPKSVILQIRMISMIDIVFLLLIYFLLTSNFRFKEGFLPISLPQENQQSPATMMIEPLEISVTSITDAQCEITIGTGNIIFINNDFTKLRNALNEIVIKHGRTVTDPIKLKPAPQSQWHHVVQTYDALWQSNMTNIIFSISQ